MTTSDKKNVKVAAGIIWQQGRFLAAKRPEGKARAGYWEFPGGKQETGESMEDALRREIKEELEVSCGIVLPWQVCSHEYSDVSVELHFMHVLDFQGTLAANDGQELRWVLPEEALALNFLPADRDVLAILSMPAELENK